ncbi:MAG: putative bifunctional diguanylate cyclase/phosphodiesterase [Thermoanaerobaculia bacterium]
MTIPFEALVVWGSAAALLLAGALMLGYRADRRRRGGRASADNMQKFRDIVETSPDLITRMSEAGEFLYVSSAAFPLLGYQREELMGRAIFEFTDTEDHAAIREYLASVCRDRFPWAFSYRAITRDGRTRWVEMSSSCDTTEATREIVSYARDVTERKRVEDHIAYLAYHDELTGLPNRTLFQDRLTIALAHARRFKRLVAVLYIDLDHFKRINDTLGHAVGDQLLDAVASRLQESTRTSDTVGRLGGDEFAVLLSEIAHEDDPARIARKILDELAHRFAFEEHQLYISASMGIALFPRDGEDPDTLMKNADSAMYRAKNSGRNGYSFCTPESNSLFLERVTLESNLRRAFEREEFVVYYQPIISAASRRPVEMEALIRWNDPSRGVVSPADFLAVAEDSRLMLPIGEWVLRSACRQAQTWAGDGSPMRITVNLSARQFDADDLPAIVERALSDCSLDPSLLGLEVTEAIASRDPAQAKKILSRLKGLGVHLIIDDFGGGTAAFRDLQRYPIDLVKIDSRSLSDGFKQREAAILSSIIAAARALDLGIIGKSVESPSQYEFLKEHRCDQMQGFLFGPPMPALAAGKAFTVDH